MKLSALAKRHIQEEIKKKFVDELREAEKAVEAADVETDKVMNEAVKDFNKVRESIADKVMAAMKKHGLTFRNDDNVTFKIEIRATFPYDSWGRDIDNKETFRETCEKNPKRNAALETRERVLTAISNTVEKALFEIELHGKKDTLEEIVDNVVKDAKSGLSE